MSDCKDRHLLIDGDILVYKFAHAAEKPVDWGEGLWTLYAYEEDATGPLDDFVQNLLDDLDADDCVIALSDLDRNFRKELEPTYKSNRKATRKPLLFHFLRDYIISNYDTFIRPGLEADDILGILATWDKYEPDKDKIIVSIDKDFNGIPCLYYDLNHTDLGLREISEEQSNQYHLLQSLTGDSVDGYPGCPGIGKVTATKLFDKHGATWATVEGAYIKAGMSKEEALLQARLARILRASDYDFKNKKPILWEPTYAVPNAVVSITGSWSEAGEVLYE